MSIKLYKVDASPAARAAMMACDIFEVPAEFVDVNLSEGENLTPEYLKKNPLHTVPVLEDNNLFIQDSHAILMYVADAYGKDDSWYPKDVRQRALVNQKLMFNICKPFQALRDVVFPAYMGEDNKVTEKKVKGIDEAYAFTEGFLSNTKYIAGEQITIADISCFATITSIVLILPLDAKKYPKTDAWVKDLEKRPFSKKHNAPGIVAYNVILRKVLEF